MELPHFRYHSLPVRTGVIERQRQSCVSCGETRSHMYTGPIYSRVRLDEVCPWCVADGTAAGTFDATFVDAHEVDHLPASVLEELTQRTPSYIGWQQEVWLSHCNDACTYVNSVGVIELETLPADAADAVRLVLRDWARTGEEREELFSLLDRDGSLRAHLFKCLHCDEFMAHVDAG